MHRGHQPAVLTRQRRRGFTLVELLVVIGIIALLISILLPSLGRAREQAIRVKCLSNMRQMVQANQFYLSEYKGYLPFSNCESGNAKYTNAKVGWLYDSPLPSGDPLDPGTVETGLFWPYVKSREVYRCPTHVYEESDPLARGRTDALTSYLMNGAVNAFGTPATYQPGRIATYKSRQFKSDDLLMWEPEERGSDRWRDGSSYPGETLNAKKRSAGLATRHGKAASVGFFDGHAELMAHGTFYDLAISKKRNQAWCTPDYPTGRP